MPRMLNSEGEALIEDQESSGNWIPIAAALCSIPILFGLVRSYFQLSIADDTSLGSLGI
jgi:hypothetical protein